MRPKVGQRCHTDDVGIGVTTAGPRCGGLALGVTRRHVQRLVAEHRIPFLKIGRFVRFDPAELNVWLDQQRVEAVRSAPRDYAPWR